MSKAAKALRNPQKVQYEIERIFKSGMQAFNAGRNVETCPHEKGDRTSHGRSTRNYWMEGYDHARRVQAGRLQQV
jgi:ribosome modulation factor